jgi:hypothetical protein
VSLIWGVQVLVKVAWFEEEGVAELKNDEDTEPLEVLEDAGVKEADELPLSVTMDETRLETVANVELDPVKHARADEVW